LLKFLEREPESGVALPASIESQAEQLQAAWTPDRRWRVVFLRNASGLRVVSIEQERL